KVPLNSRYAHDLPKMADAVTERTKLVFIANPNNPTGTIVRRAELNAFLERIPEQVLVVLDEAYFEFAREDEEYPDGIDYLHRGKNVVVMRTFSKTYGLAGLRIGYLFAQSEVTDAIERVREPFNVNSLGQAAAVAALSDSAHIERTVQNNRHGIGRISEALSAAGAEAGESFANFVFADLKRPARPVFEALLRRGVIIRSGEAFGTPTCVRVSVGTDEEIDIFVEEFRNVMQELDR
ncbi:MAG TPA: aminotransferase class I/II-fold pyridoxal phosphate-dependent enzyme, partial [Fimbriimonadaceae bacterium]|nr:aminotransferase class I/II-fold pyridoxal phosphate-dependent enzyme [Fimbriimonadaceae bacterium]